MNRVDIRINEVKERGEKVLVCLLPLGDPDLNKSHELVELYLKGGADIIELGMPSHKPYLDSVNIAESNQRSFQAEENLDKYFDTIKAIRKDYPKEPFDVMAYADTVKSYGVNRFVDKLIESDMDCFLLADATVVAPDIVSTIDPVLEKANIYRIRFMPHPFQENLLPDIGENAKGFVILQAIADPQNQRAKVVNENKDLVQRMRNSGTKAAVTFAYGINNPERAREAVELGPDAILVGTVTVDGIKAGDWKALEEIISGLKKATLPG